jgi:transposase
MPRLTFKYRLYPNRQQQEKPEATLEHVCPPCGLVTTRDHAAASEILRLGLSLQAQTKSEVGTCVA